MDVYGKAAPQAFTIEDWTFPLLKALLKSLFVPGSRLAIEGQYMGRNAATAIELGRVRGYVEGIAVSMGYKVVDVAPSTWQAWLGAGGRMGRAERKARALEEAVLCGGSPANQDEADALCMALWLKEWMQGG